MKSILFAIIFAAAPAFATDLSCLCEGPNMSQEMACSQFGISPCEFSTSVGTTVWNQAFSPTASGILYTWYSDKNNIQQASLTSGVPLNFQYYGDNQVYTMTCITKN